MAPSRGQPPTGKIPITYRYNPALPVYQHLQAEAERFGTTLQEEMHRALVDWFTGGTRAGSAPAPGPPDEPDDDAPSAGARAAADAFM